MKYGPVYQAYLNFVHNDPEETLKVLSAYYPQHAEYLHEKNEKFEKIITMLQPEISIFHQATINKGISKVMDSGCLSKFSQFI